MPPSRGGLPLRSCDVFFTIMGGQLTNARIHRRLIDTLYVDAMVLADEARAYFDELGRQDRDTMQPMARVAFSCESLKVTTRLMHIIAWLLTQRAIDSGEMTYRDALDPSRRLGPAPVSDPDTLRGMPDAARNLIDASTELFRRVARLDAAQETSDIMPGPARSMQDRLANAF